MTGSKPIDRIREMLAGFVTPDMPFMERRAQAAKFAQAFTMPEGVSVEADTVGGVPVEWVIPHEASGAPILLHLHGGGYVLGDPASSRPLTTALALKSGARVVSVDYRLAPEHPFPAAVDDAVAVYRALLVQGRQAKAIAVGGESAGGGLAIAMLLAAREKGLELPACAFAISPWTDLSCAARTFDTCAKLDPMLARRVLKEMADAYLAGASAWKPLASPLLGDLRGLPPLLIHVGSDEVLLDDAQLLHSQAQAAGVASRLRVYAGMIHVWHMFHTALPEGEAAIDEIVAFAGSHWRR